MIAVALTIAACSSGKSPEPDTPSLGGINLPLAVGRSKSDVRATITSNIGGQSQTLLFDTGSVGLSVFASSIPSTLASLTGAAFQEPFSGGVVLSGVVVSLPVEIAGAPTAGPIVVRLVQSAACDSSTPSCPAKDGLSKFSESIGADGFVGAGLWSSGDLFSPLTQLASGIPNSIAVTWNGTTGSVTLNPTLNETPVATLQLPPASPATLTNGANAWDNLAVPICWQIRNAQTTCAPTALDTGASAMSLPVGFPGGPSTNVNRLSSGEQIVASADTNSPPFLTFTSGRDLGENLVTVIPGQSFVDSGLQFFKDFIVVFNLTNGSISLFSPN